jgi:hypothetical protein
MDDADGAMPVMLSLPRAVDAALAADIEKQSVYVSEELQSLRVDADLRSVRLVLRPGADEQRVRDKAQRYLEVMLKRFRRIEPTVHHRRPRAPDRPLQRDVFGQLVARGWACQHSEGVVSLSGPALALLEGIDLAFDRAYRQRFAAQPRAYPAMVKAGLLARCGYFEMHPNALSFVSHLLNDFDEIEAFRQANVGAAELRTTHAGAFAPVHHCLNPAACFPCYENLENHSMAPQGLVLTWKGRVFRYESANTVGLDRLREFNVRELVFIGTDAMVRQGRVDALALSTALMDEWDLSGRVETATDPFFATVYAARTFWQESMEVKFELCLDIEPDTAGAARSIAAGSMNLHGAFFGDRFNIRDHTGEPAYSGCVGWGLERWVLAVFTQHGLDPAHWPASLRALLS